MSYLMGIDLGTSSVKTLIIDEAGTVIAVASAGYDIIIQKQDWAEQDMEVLWQAARQTIRETLKEGKIDAGEIKGIGFSGQMHGIVPLDKDKRPVKNAMIWVDQRAKEQVKVIDSLQARDTILNPAVTGFFGSSLLWIKDNEPDIYDRINKAVLPKDYIRYRICGEIGTEITDASGTLLFDIPNEQWSSEVVSRLGLREDILPPVGTPESRAGVVTKVCQEETGLRAGTLVVYGGGDQAMHSLGNGIIRPGIVSSNIGTAGQISCAADRPLYDPKFRTNSFCHPVSGLWSLVGASMNGGVALKWLNQNLLSSYGYKEINEKAEAVKPGSEGLVFVPYLCGERSPHMNPDAKAILFGMTLGHGQDHVIRAVMEGVVYSLRDCLEIFYQLGISCDRIIASGGGAKSRVWLQMQADILQKEIYTTGSEEEACLGAAMAAGVGAGVYQDWQQACEALVKTDGIAAVPNPDNKDVYDERFETYRKLYINNKELF